MKDYKVFCFNGKPEYVAVYSDRQKNNGVPCQEIYDTDWNLIKEHTNHYELPESFTGKPKYFDNLLKYAEILSKDFKHTRVDFFIEKDKIYFGEITFTSSAGFGKFSSREFAEKMGSYIKIN